MTELTVFAGDRKLGQWDGQREDFRGYIEVLSPKRIRIVELLETKAPNPSLTLAYCCLIDTVIFYVRPFRVNPFKRWWKSSTDKKWRESETGSFYEWDCVRHKLRRDSRFEWGGKVYAVGGGKVFWKDRRWWMEHHAREAEVTA